MLPQCYFVVTFWDGMDNSVWLQDLCLSYVLNKEGV
jgi:hypothetical protein